MAMGVISICLASAALLRRGRPVGLGWTGKLLLLLLLAGALRHLSLEQWPALLPAHALTLAASALLLAEGALIWPFLRHLNTQFTQATELAVTQRLSLAALNSFESRRWLELAEQIAHIGHWRYTQADRRMLWSDEIYQIFGVAKASLTPSLENCLAAFHPDDRVQVTGKFRAALLTGAGFELTVRLLRPDGALRHVIARGVSQTDDFDAVVSVFGVLLDITDQKQVEQGLKEAKAATELANRALHEMAMQDSLTGLPNRRMFDSTLAQEFRRAARDNAMLSLVMIDLDHFKGYNDLYGHPAGDQCLRLVAEALAAVPQRPADLVARYGGEELVILLPGTALPGAEIVAGLAADAVLALKLEHRANPAGLVTVSCGVATYQPEVGPHVPMMLVERADRALYVAKQTGRNRVCSEAGVAAE
jgi:diguanylate cyclase (GGDEF)-like protein/PAS domain S-box-containing protein